MKQTDKKQTAVQYIIQNLLTEPKKESDFIFNNKILQSALVIESNQIINAWDSGFKSGYKIRKKSKKYFKDYYL